MKVIGMLPIGFALSIVAPATLTGGATGGAAPGAVAPDQAPVVAHRLDQLGIAAEAACDGHEALALVRRDAYDVIFMDCQMPEMNGYEATRRIRHAEKQTHRPPVHIVAMTANAMRKDQEVCLQAGMNDYISKPFRPSIVRARVRNHIQSVHQRRLLEQLALLRGAPGPLHDHKKNPHLVRTSFSQAARSVSTLPQKSPLMRSVRYFHFTARIVGPTDSSRTSVQGGSMTGHFGEWQSMSASGSPGLTYTEWDSGI